MKSGPNEGRAEERVVPEVAPDAWVEVKAVCWRGSVIDYVLVDTPLQNDAQILGETLAATLRMQLQPGIFPIPELRF